MKRRSFIVALLALSLAATLTLTRRADLTRIVPAVWGSNDPANRMRGTVTGDILITSGIVPVPTRKVAFSTISVDGEKWSARVDYRSNNYELAGFDGSKSGMVLVDPVPDPRQPEHNMCAAEIYGSSYAAGSGPGPAIGVACVRGRSFLPVN